ncbi:MAG: hypothetical protein JST54_21950 [Deltaproteobacteria bacterium]|nr:hypothetical protein [Deltaproteobacteria bacterium]
MEDERTSQARVQRALSGWSAHADSRSGVRVQVSSFPDFVATHLGEVPESERAAAVAWMARFSLALARGRTGT